MELPARISQHKAESDSYAILLYKLRDIGIFRNVTESDYGIDFEIEMVVDSKVTGRYFKAQVKSSENLRIRKKDRVPVVGGIKESTLYYWTELSYRAHVIIYAIDLKTEDIYLSRPIFWQASKLINGDKKSKTVEFLPVLTKKSDGPIKDVLPVFLTRMFALSPSLPDILYSHKTALRYLKRFFGLYGDVYHYDFHCEIHDVDAFKTLLDTCRVLLWGQDYKELGLEGKQRKFLFSFDYWVENSGDWATDEVTNLSAQTPLRVLLPLLLDTLRKLRQDVLAAKYYWRYKDRTYLRLVYENRIPDDSTQQTIQEWGCKFDEYQHNPIGFSYFEMSSSI